MKGRVINYNKTKEEIEIEWLPSIFEKIFGHKNQIKTYKYNGSTYMVGGDKVWYDKETGKEFGRIKFADDYIRKQEWN